MGDKKKGTRKQSGDYSVNESRCESNSTLIAKSLEISADRYWINQAVPGELGRDCGRRLLVLSCLSALARSG